MPRRILVALGLGAVAVAEEGCVSACLDVVAETESVSACLSPPIEPTGDTSDGATSTDTGPLDGTSVGPCLGQQATDTATSTESGSGSGSGDGSGTESGSATGSGSGGESGSGSESDSGSTGVPAPHDPGEVVERVLESGALPSDVAARLRRRGR